MKVRVVRAFLLGGARQEPGTVVEVPDSTGRELLWMGKAEAAQDMPTSTTMTTATAGELVQSKPARKGASHAE